MEGKRRLDQTNQLSVDHVRDSNLRDNNIDCLANTLQPSHWSCHRNRDQNMTYFAFVRTYFLDTATKPLITSNTFIHTK